MHNLAGAFAGVITAHLMFGLPLLSPSTHARSGGAQLFSEFVATFGLLAVIWGCARHRPSSVAYAVGAYITAAYWFTASTSFANPAVALARSMTNTFSGIRPADVAGFVVVQLAGAFAATLVFQRLIPALRDAPEELLVEHDQGLVSAADLAVDSDQTPGEAVDPRTLSSAGKSWRSGS